MADIKSTTEELTVSGSIVPDTKEVLESTINEELWWETIKFLTMLVSLIGGLLTGYPRTIEYYYQD